MDLADKLLLGGSILGSICGVTLGVKKLWFNANREAKRQEVLEGRLRELEQTVTTKRRN